MPSFSDSFKTPWLATNIRGADTCQPVFAVSVTAPTAQLYLKSGLFFGKYMLAQNLTPLSLPHFDTGPFLTPFIYS